MPISQLKEHLEVTDDDIEMLSPCAPFPAAIEPNAEACSSENACTLQTNTSPMSISPYSSPDVDSPMQTDTCIQSQVLCHPNAEESPMSLSMKCREPPHSSLLRCSDKNKKRPRTVTIRDLKCSSSQQSIPTSTTCPSITLSIKHFLEG